MKDVTSKPEPSHLAFESNSHLFDDWFDPIENMPSRPGEFHPESLTEPDLILSHHPARAIA